MLQQVDAALAPINMHVASFMAAVGAGAFRQGPSPS
jgi:hypothetical protein